MPLLLATAQSDLHWSFAALVLGVLVGAFGHITQLRWLIVLGILIVGLDSVVFVLVLRPGAG